MNSAEKPDSAVLASQGVLARSLSDRREILLAAILVTTVLLSFWFRAAFPPFGIWAPTDDALFVRMAEHLAAGDWLGPYDFHILAKGLFFPLFVAVNKATGLPLKFSEHLIYLLVALLAASTVARLTGQRRLLQWAFVVLALNPTGWLAGLLRVVRDPLYTSLSLAVVSLAALYCLTPGKNRVLGIALGLVGGCYWLTREEGVWLLPALLVLALPRLKVKVQDVRIGTMPALRSATSFIWPPLVAFLSVVMLVNTINLVEYGVFRNNDFRAGPFPDAYGALARIRHGEWKRYLVFPRESRQWAYSVSPAASELAPYFDGDLEKRWWIAGNRDFPRPWGCKDDPQACDEIPSWLFVWALRDAVSAAGHYRSAADADTYYRRLAREINDACERQTIPCREPRASMAPVWRGHYLRDTMNASGQVLLTLIHLNRGKVGVPASLMTSEQARIFAAAINSPVSGFDEAGRSIVAEPSWLDMWRVGLAGDISMLYTEASLPLFALALASYFFLLFGRGRVKSGVVSGNTLLILTALLVAVVSRVGLLGFLEATSIPSNNMLYLLPVVPIYFLFVVVSIGAALVAIRHIVRGAPRAS